MRNELIRTGIAMPKTNHAPVDGSIIDVASTDSVRPATNSIVYSGIKAGLLGITRATVAEFNARNIRVNGIALSIMPTERIVRRRPAERETTRTATAPLGRPSTVEPAARAIPFLASDDASATVQIRRVDGAKTVTNL